jgi:hypothetical protein
VRELRDVHSNQRKGRVRAGVGRQHDASDFGIAKIRRRRLGCAEQELVAIDDLHDAVFVRAVAEVDAIPCASGRDRSVPADELHVRWFVDSGLLRTNDRRRRDEADGDLVQSGGVHCGFQDSSIDALAVGADWRYAIAPAHLRAGRGDPSYFEIAFDAILMRLTMKYCMPIGALKTAVSKWRVS